MRFIGTTRPLTSVNVAGLAAITLSLLGYGIYLAATPVQSLSPELSFMRNVYVVLAATALVAMVIRKPWSPLGAPLLYMATVVFAPPIYVLQNEVSLFLLEPANISLRSIQIASLVFASYVLGTVIAGALLSHKRIRGPGSGQNDGTLAWIYRAGCALAVVSVLAKAYSMVATAGEAYGANQFADTLPVRMNQMSIIAAIVAAALVMFASLQLTGLIMGKFAAICFIVSCALALASGGRFQVLVILVMILMLKWRYTGFVRPWLVPLAGIAVLVLFSVVSQVRLDPSVSRDFSGFPVLVTTLTDFSSVFLSVSLTNEYAGQGSAFLGGSTYVAAIPGVDSLLALAGISLAVEPGALAYRTLIGMTDPNLGLGFSLPAESYLNFGMAGVVFFFVGFGCLLTVLYRRFMEGVGVAQGFGYVLLVSCLPYTFRADVLSLLNLWLYPIILIAIVRLVTAPRASASVHATYAVQGPGSEENVAHHR